MRAGFSPNDWALPAEVAGGARGAALPWDIVLLGWGALLKQLLVLVHGGSPESAGLELVLLHTRLPAGQRPPCRQRSLFSPLPESEELLATVGSW